MEHRIIKHTSPFDGIQITSRSPFLVEPEENELAPFSFRDVLDVFKKKDSGTSSSSSSDSGSGSSSEKGSGLGTAIATGLAGLLGSAGSIASILPSIGVGSKSRIAETNATATANAQVLNAQNQLLLTQQNTEKSKSKETEKLVLIGFVAFLVIAVVVGVLFMKK